MRPRFRALLARAIEEGLNRGVRRAAKQLPAIEPYRDTIETCADDAIWHEIDEAFMFDPEHEG